MYVFISRRSLWRSLFCVVSAVRVTFVLLVFKVRNPGASSQAGPTLGTVLPTAPSVAGLEFEHRPLTTYLNILCFHGSLFLLILILLGQRQFYFLFFTWLAWLSKDGVEVLNKITF